MPSRTAKFVSAIFASILAGAPLATTSRGETVAADNCLSGPKGQTPPGSHWYYRIEHSTKRHCWYLREEGDNLSQAPQNILPSSKPLPPQTDTVMQNSVANARAELPARTGRDNGPDAAAPANAAIVASRWPEASGMSQVSSPRPATSKLAASAPPNSTAAPATSVAAVAVATADSSSQNQPGTIPQLFIAAVGALALASVTASLIFRFGRARRLRPRAIRARRGPIRESTDDDRIVLSDYPAADIRPRRPRFSRVAGKAGAPDDRMAEFLSHISRRAPT